MRIEEIKAMFEFDNTVEHFYVDVPLGMYQIFPDVVRIHTTNCCDEIPLERAEEILKNLKSEDLIPVFIDEPKPMSLSDWEFDFQIERSDPSTPAFWGEEDLTDYIKRNACSEELAFLGLT